MRKLALVVLVLLVGPFAVFGADVRFVVPTWDNPHYQVRIPIEIGPAPASVKEVLLAGVRLEPIVVFRGAKAVDASKPLEPGAYEIVLDYAWSSRKTYAFTLVLAEEDPAKGEKKAFSSPSPASGGIPAGAAEGFHRVVKVEEDAGIERASEIVEVTVTASRAALASPELRLFDGGKELPYQVLDFRGSEPVEKAAATNPPSATAKIAFPLDIGPRERKLLLILKGKPRVAATAGLKLEGEGLGKSVASKALKLGFHAPSGQVLTIDAPKEGVKLWNKAGVIHWNPDVFIPGLAWDHSFDWNPPAVFEERTGPFLYVNARRGPMPRIKDVELEVRYRMDAFHPWFVSETMMTVTKDLGVIAVRNDEMVLFKELFDSLMYRAADGRVVTMPLKELPETPFGLVHIAPADLPWVGLISTAGRYGLFSLRLAAATSALGVGGDFAHKAGTYFYAPSDGDYVYWVRPLIYTWADHSTNTLLSFVPRGSFFYERNAYVVLRLGEGTAEALDALRLRLGRPVRVF